MKKIGILVLLVVLAGMILFVGCRRDDPGPPSITIWCWDPSFNIYAMNEAAKIYARTRPDVPINIVEVPWDDLQQRLITAFSARQYDDLPDIILMQDNAIEKNVRTFPDRFLALNDMVDLSQFAQYKLDFGFINGRNYGVPFDNGASATFIRRDIVERAGLQVSDFDGITWERFYELGRQVRDRTGVALISTDAEGPDLISIMLHGAGTWFFDAQGNPYIRNNAALRRALELKAQGLSEGVIMNVSDWSSYVGSLNTGAAAGTVQGAWAVGFLSEARDQHGQWAVVRTPRMGTIPSSVNYSSNGGSGWMILANSRHPELAADFLDKTYAGSVEFYETILYASGAISTWLPAARSSVYAEPQPFFGGQRIFEDLVNYAGNVPHVQYGIFNYEARTAVTRHLADIVAGRMTIDAALDAAQREVEFIIAGQ